jgi:hypothetical protein
MNLTATAMQFFELIAAGNTLEAISLYYHEEAIQIEPGGQTVTGKAALLQAEQDNLARVKSFSIAIPAYAVNESTGTVAGSMNVFFETNAGKKKKIEEAFVQQWEKGQLKYQRFYYKDIIDAD